jgi:hypothetical protein
MVFFAVALELLCYFVPSLWLLVPSASLTLVIISLRSINMPAACRESFELTRIGIWETVGYQAIPIIIALLGYSVLHWIPFNLLHFGLGHIGMYSFQPIAVMLLDFAGRLYAAVIALTLVPMQVDLYHWLQWRQDCNDKLLPLTDARIEGTRPPQGPRI